MNALYSILVASFVLIGLLALLDWGADKWRGIPANLSRGRRSFLGLIISFIGGILIGTGSWYENKRARDTLYLLFDLEVVLAQLEGLVSGALAQGDVTQLLPSMEKLVEKIDEYGSKAARLMPELRERLSGKDHADIDLGADMIISGLRELKVSTLKVGDVNGPLNAIQKGVSLARTTTRELIDARISRS